MYNVCLKCDVLDIAQTCSCSWTLSTHSLGVVLVSSLEVYELLENR